MRSSIRRALGLVAVALAVSLLAPAVPTLAAGRIRVDRPVRPSTPARSRAVPRGPATNRTAPSREGPYAPASSLHFDAIPRIGGNWPADPTGAIGDSWYFTAVNASYALFDLSGTVVLGPEPLEPFFPYPAGTAVYDPKVVFDQYDHTFVLVFLAVDDGDRKSWIAVVTIPDATASDTSTWCARRIVGDQISGDGKQWADYPGLGYTEDRVTLTTNQLDWSMGDIVYAQILSFPKENLYDCGRAVKFHAFGGRDTRHPDGTVATTIQPAQSVGPNPTKQYLLSFHKTDSGSFLSMWRIVETSNGGLSLSKGEVQVPRASIAPYGTQGGGKIDGGGAKTTWWDPGDLRLVNAWYDDGLGKLYTAHAVAKDLTPDKVTDGYLESVVRWYELDPAGKLSASALSRKGIVGTPETDAGWPVVGTDADGNLFITYSRAGAVTDEYLSAWAAEIRPGGMTATIAMLAPGQSRVEVLNGVERWGDFNAISRDAATGGVAMVNQYALADGGATTRDWQQTVDLVGHA